MPVDGGRGEGILEPGSGAIYVYIWERWTGYQSGYGYGFLGFVVRGTVLMRVDGVIGFGMFWYVRYLYVT